MLPPGNVGLSGFSNQIIRRQDFAPRQRASQPRSGCTLQPNVAAAATLGLGRSKTINRNAVASFPDVTLIPFNLVLLQQQSQFILKINLLMMLSLVGNVFLHVLEV
jgi:hypothetical protein